MSITSNIIGILCDGYIDLPLPKVPWSEPTPQPTKSQARDIRQKLSGNSLVDSYLFGI